MQSWNYASAGLVAEAFARRFTTESCRELVAAGTPLDEVGLCRSSLDKTNPEWYSFLLKAEKRNLSIEKCQALVGLQGEQVDKVRGRELITR
jgi:hypothetical protein